MLPSKLLGQSMGFDCQKYKCQEDKIVSRIAWRNREHRAGMMPAWQSWWSASTKFGHVKPLYQ